VTPAWKLVMKAGMPDGAVRPGPVRLDRRRIRIALAELARGIGALEPRQVEPLLAWLRGWQHHWPRSFAEIVGADAEGLIPGLEARRPDPNRYLKLRRIAVENLSRVL
jgi:hypothetical protein